MDKEQLRTKLDAILNQLQTEEGNEQTLAFEALAIIERILIEDPFDIYALIDRMHINANVLKNTPDIIKDAQFIIENDAFQEDKMIGYDWLFWVYDEVMSMPEKAIETIEEQLIEVHSIFKKPFLKDAKEGALLDKLAYLKYQNQQITQALDIWYKAYLKYPYFDNNGFVALLFLEHGDLDKAEKLALTHYSWSYQTEDGYRLKYGIELKKLYEAKKLDKHPTLIGLLFNIIRNEKEYFKLNQKLAFFDTYHSELEEWSIKFPKNAMIWTAIAHTHHYDTKNYENAFQAYSKLFDCENTIEYTAVSRIRKAAKKSGNAFLELPFQFKGSSTVMYNALTDFSALHDKATKKKTKKKLAELAVNFGEIGYKQYKAYLQNGKGDTHNNQPHMFAMLCNNYAHALGEYADLHLKKKERVPYYTDAGDIHLEGYEVSPFVENIENASRDYFKGKNYVKSIACSLLSIKDYSNELSIYDYQFHYWQIVRSYIALDDLENATIYYNKAKALFVKVGAGSKDATQKFIFTAKLCYEFAVTKKQEYQKYIPEMEWFLAKKIAIEEEPKEQGLIGFYLGLCYKEAHEKEKAISAFQTTIEYLEDANWGFYDDKYDLAKTYLNEYGVKVKRTKPKRENEKSLLKRIKDAIIFPFLMVGIIGGFIWAIAANVKKEKKNKG